VRLDVESPLDRDCELRELGVADGLAELLSASSIPAAVHRSPISPEDQCSKLRCVVRTQSSIDSQGLVDRYGFLHGGSSFDLCGITANAPNRSGRGRRTAVTSKFYTRRDKLRRDGFRRVMPQRPDR
jgi:hypothetical protein